MNGSAFAEQCAEVQLTLDSALHADRDEGAIHRERIHVGLQVLCTHVVEDEIGTVAVGFGPQHLDEILVLVVDGDVRAERLTKVEFVRLAGRDCDGDAESLCDLNGVRADAAAAAVDQQDLSGSHTAVHDEIRPNSRRHLWKCRCRM